MERDLASVFAMVLAAFSVSCGGQSDLRCSPQYQPPSVTTVSVALVQCVAVRDERPVSMGELEAVAIPTATTTTGTAPDYDPRTCDIDCARTCGSGFSGGSTHCGRDVTGNVTCTTEYAQHACGRSTEGAPALGAFDWATVFALESISAIAFTRLAAELALLDAPAELVERARLASAEEERHADLAASFAPAQEMLEAPVVREVGPRSLLEIAIENAREGCVRETWGAYAAASQRGAPADDFEVFARAVADDERGHAAWSWALDTWARNALSPADVAALDDAHETARAHLAHELPAKRKSEATLLFGLLRKHPSSTFAS